MNVLDRRWRRLIVCAAWLPALGCSPAAAVNCPTDTPTCPSPAPTYQADVGPLIAKYCARCHATDGGDPGVLLQGYDDVTGTQVAHVRSRITMCRMPPADQPQPTAAERTTILGWFACCEANGGTCAR